MNIKKIFAYTLCATFISANAFAAGFQFRYQSAEAMGTAFSSAGTTGQALSQTYFNPASYMLMNKDDKKSSFGFEGTLTLPLGAKATTDGTGAKTDDFADPSFTPSFYYGRMLNEKTALTVSLTTPWATHTDYDNDWDGRYKALETFLGSFNLTPAISRKINDKLILTGGVQVQYLFGTLSTMFNAAQAFGNATGDNDIKTEFDGNSIAGGIALGATYLLNEKTTLAFNYTSAIKNELEGDFRATTVTGGAQTDAFRGGNLPDSNNAELTFKTPDIIALGVSHIFSEKLTGHFSANYVTWGSIKDLTTVIDGTASSTPQDWDDSIFVSGGATMKMGSGTILRTGLFYETSAPDELRSPRALDAEKVGLAIGSTFLVAGMKLDLALNQIFYVGDIEVDLPTTTTGPLPTSPAYAGEIDANVTLIRAGLTYNW